MPLFATRGKTYPVRDCPHRHGVLCKLQIETTRARKALDDEIKKEMAEMDELLRGKKT